jgi:hypothetical protein
LSSTELDENEEDAEDGRAGDAVVINSAAVSERGEDDDEAETKEEEVDAKGVRKTASAGIEEIFTVAAQRGQSTWGFPLIL